MTESRKGPWQGCPVGYAASIFGDKWCFVLLRDVLLHGKRSYSEFLESEEGISSNILADRLSRLEEFGMLRRQVDPRKRSRVCYFPTRKARDLIPALLSLMIWSARYDKMTKAPASFLETYSTHPKRMIAHYETEIDRVDKEILRGD